MTNALAGPVAIPEKRRLVMWPQLTPSGMHPHGFHHSGKKLVLGSLVGFRSPSRVTGGMSPCNPTGTPQVLDCCLESPGSQGGVRLFSQESGVIWCTESGVTYWRGYSKGREWVSPADIPPTPSSPTPSRGRKKTQLCIRPSH